MEGASSLIFLGLMVAIFYFMLIRPQKRRMEEHRRLIESISPGDEVVTIGGMVGTVRSMDEDEFRLEVASGTVLRFVKSAIARRVTDESEDGVESQESLEEEEA